VKHVSFAKKLIHDSPAKKSQPLNLQDHLKFGSINFPLENHPGVDSNSNLNSRELIPAKHVFGHIKSGIFNCREIKATYTTPKASSPDKAYCKRCLRAGHSWLACVRDVRCRWCYDHMEKSYLKKRYSKKVVWRPKTVVRPDTAALEPCVERSSEMHA
jgi:hypothetical protein